jgi:hypothetical protein
MPPRSNRPFHRAMVAVEQSSTAQIRDHACPFASRQQQDDVRPQADERVGLLPVQLQQPLALPGT